MAIILIPKLTGKCVKMCVFTAYTAAAACWPMARLG